MMPRDYLAKFNLGTGVIIVLRCLPFNILVYGGVGAWRTTKENQTYTYYRRQNTETTTQKAY